MTSVNMFGIHVISVIYLFLNNIVLSNADKVEFDWKVNSSFGQHILANSSPADKSQRHLEDNMFSDYDNIVNYSIKYLGCYRWFEWNDEARDDEDLRLSAKRVVSYRLCPSGSCSDSSEKGCDSNYGEYIVDLSLFLETYFGALREKSINENGDDGGYNNYQDYAYCNQYNYDADGNRFLKYYDVLYDDNIFEKDYFMGPHCTEDGISIGLFTDDTCTMVAGGGELSGENNGAAIFSVLTNGDSLPFADENIVERECIACEVDGEYGQMNEFCETLYATSGKCEKKMNMQYQDNNSCNFIAGLPALKYDWFGNNVGASTTATVFIVFFAFACAGLGVYVWYLYQKANPKDVFFYE